MKYSITPKNHLDAFSFFMQVPFYSIWDVLCKKELIFDHDEITSIELNLIASPTYRMIYKAHGFYGYVDIREKFSRADFMNVEVKTVNKSFMVIFQESLKDSWNLTFHRYSPVLWILATTILTTFVYWLLTVPYHILNPEIVGNTMCNLNCVNTAWKKIMNLQMHLSLFFACMAVLVYLTFFKAKVYNEAKFYRSIQTSAFIVFSFLSIRMLSDVNVFFSSEFQTQIQMVYEPQNFKTTAERGIASQKGVSKVD
jgi:hypothetical protein